MSSGSSLTIFMSRQRAISLLSLVFLIINLKNKKNKTNKQTKKLKKYWQTEAKFCSAETQNKPTIVLVYCK